MRIRAKVTSKGQVTLPARLRARLGIRPGDTVTFVDDAAGTFSIEAGNPDLAALRGAVKGAGNRVTAQAIADLIEAARADANRAVAAFSTRS